MRGISAKVHFIETVKLVSGAQMFTCPVVFLAHCGNFSEIFHNAIDLAWRLDAVGNHTRKVQIV